MFVFAYQLARMFDPAMERACCPSLVKYYRELDENYYSLTCLNFIPISDFQFAKLYQGRVSPGD